MSCKHSLNTQGEVSQIRSGYEYDYRHPYKEVQGTDSEVTRFQSTSGDRSNHGNGCEVFTESTFNMEGIVLELRFLDAVGTRIKVFSR